MRAGGAGASRVARALDFVSDWGVLAYAAWTLIAYAGMVTRARVTILVPVWLVLAAGLVAALFVLARRAGPGASARSLRSGTRPGALLGNRYLLAIGIGAGVVSALLAAARAPWLLAWAPALIAVGIAIRLGRLTAAPEPGYESSPVTWAADAFAVATGLGFAAMSLFINRPNADDVFYVNRATATAQLNRIPVRDVIFTNEQVHPTSGAGLPTDTFSALEGAIARFVGVHGPSVAYYAVPPLMTFFATWALWRLLRSWAPRNLVLCFALGCVYWLFSAQSGLTTGSFFLSRMWQGKVVFIAWLIPTLYTYLTRWVERREALTAVLLVAGGMSSIGLTGSAAFVAPLVFGTATIALVAGREWRGLPVLAAAAAFPFLVGFVATRKYPLASELGGVIQSPSWYFHEVLGVGAVAALGAFALWSSPWLARSRAPARLTTAIALVALLLLAPGALPALSHAAGLTGALRRTLWVIPLPAVVGLLAGVPAGALLRRVMPAQALNRRLAAPVPATLAAAALVAFGHPLWESVDGNSLWASHPTWKVSHSMLTDAHGILRHYGGTGTVLADEPVMGTVALLTIEPKAVDARWWYARLTPGLPYRPERRALTRFVSGRTTLSPPRLRQALSDLRVGIVCAIGSRHHVLNEVEMLGAYPQRFRVHDLVCLQRE